MKSTHPATIESITPPAYLRFPREVGVNGIPCLAERIRLDRLADWKQAHDLQYAGTTFVGQLGVVFVYWPKEWLQP